MYAPVILQPDPPRPTSRYVANVDRVPLAVRLGHLAQRIRRTKPWVIDAITASAFVALGLATHYAPEDAVDYRDPTAFSTALVVLGAVPYYFRRRFPLAVLVVSTVAVVTLVARDYSSGTAPSMLLFGVYTVAASASPRDRVLGAATISLGLAVVAVAGAPDLDGAGMVINVAFFSVAYFVGSTVRNRRLYTEQLEERARLLERERDEQSRRAVADERLRIAQELHDVVAHSMGVIAVQAGVGAHVIDDDPAEAKRALEAIGTTSRSTLTEIRRLLGVLRDDGTAGYEPAPGLADLDRLVRDVGATGLPVDVRVEGERHDVPPGVDLTAYRIVQEALTNVIKHAGPARAVVTVGYEPGALALEVVDDGRGVNGRATAGGHGLLGMRERVGVYGGTFDAGPRTGGGFRVAVRLPYAPAGPGE
jgi:signal transduction histidine kinase